MVRLTLSSQFEAHITCLQKGQLLRTRVAVVVHNELSVVIKKNLYIQRLTKKFDVFGFADYLPERKKIKLVTMANFGNIKMVTLDIIFRWDNYQGLISKSIFSSLIQVFFHFEYTKCFHFYWSRRIFCNEEGDNWFLKYCICGNKTKFLTRKGSFDLY